MKLRFTMLLLAGTALSSPALAENTVTASNSQPALADCDRAIAVVNQGPAADKTVTLDQIKTLRSQKNAQACHDMLARVDPAAVATKSSDSSQIVVQQPAPTVRVEQASPQVTVAQPQPDVNVTQAKPEIFVHQPAPTVTIDIPQPEITVKMPKPDVNVSMAQPQVHVTEAKPQVQVIQPSQPQVEVQGGKPQVSVQQTANAQPKVTVEPSGQPQVHYDRAAPKVVVNQAQGQPQVKVEQMDAAPSAQQRQAAADASISDKGANDTISTQSVNTAEPKAAAQQVTVSRIDAMNLYNTKGDNLGDIERVVMDKDNQPHVVIGNGGFLGLGEKRVAIPLQRTAMRGDRLVIQGLTDDQIRAMPTWNKSSGYRELAKDRTLSISTIE